jgi:cytosine/adenosine deaminase-related metal-dependent hydrolase
VLAERITISATPWSRPTGRPAAAFAGIDAGCIARQMFREMQAALLFARGKEVRNNALRGNSPFKTIPVRSREALEWATINGARAFRMDSQIGTLSPGKKADVVMLRATDENMVPVWDPI